MVTFTPIYASADVPPLISGYTGHRAITDYEVDNYECSLDFLQREFFNLWVRNNVISDYMYYTIYVKEVRPSVGFYEDVFVGGFISYSPEPLVLDYSNNETPVINTGVPTVTYLFIANIDAQTLATSTNAGLQFDPYKALNEYFYFDAEVTGQYWQFIPNSHNHYFYKDQTGTKKHADLYTNYGLSKSAVYFECINFDPYYLMYLQDVSPEQLDTNKLNSSLDSIQNYLKNINTSTSGTNNLINSLITKIDNLVEVGNKTNSKLDALNEALKIIGENTKGIEDALNPEAEPVVTLGAVPSNKIDTPMTPPEMPKEILDGFMTVFTACGGMFIVSIFIIWLILTKFTEK